MAQDEPDAGTRPDTPAQILLCPPEGPPLGIYDGIPRASDTIFVNYDGATLTTGQDHAPSNTTQIGECAGTMEPYGVGAKRDASFQALVALYAAFDITFTDTRPASDSYAMIVATPTNPYGGTVGGISPVDCGDQNPNSVSFAFISEDDAMPASMQGTDMAHELGHAFGLSHVNDGGDVMNPAITPSLMVFKDECIWIKGGNYCMAEHQQHCGMSFQNDYQELMGVFGPAAPDAGPPNVEITSPNDGDTFDTGASFTVTAEASDDKGVVQVDLYEGGTLQSTDDAEPWAWDITDIPEGTYSFHAIAMDGAGNEATSNTVTIQVGASDPDDDGGDDGGSDDGGNDDGGDDDGGDDDDGGADGDDGGEGGDDGEEGDADEGDDALPASDDAGCGCTSASGTEPAWLLLLVPLVRRRP